MLLAEMFVYVRSHDHVRFAIPDEPLWGSSFGHARVDQSRTGLVLHATCYIAYMSSRILMPRNAMVLDETSTYVLPQAVEFGCTQATCWRFIL